MLFVAYSFGFSLTLRQYHIAQAYRLHADISGKCNTLLGLKTVFKENAPVGLHIVFPAYACSWGTQDVDEG